MTSHRTKLTITRYKTGSTALYKSAGVTGNDLCTVNSSVSGFLWFDKQSVRWFTSEITSSLHRAIVLTIWRERGRGRGREGGREGEGEGKKGKEERERESEREGEEGREGRREVVCELNSAHTHTHAHTRTHTVSSAHSESANGVNRDGGRFIDNHQIFVNMKDLSPLVCPTPV